jgi:hypothetical protein
MKPLHTGCADVEFFALLGGGVKEPGWINTTLSKSRHPLAPARSAHSFR